jgi:hypothetical protein
MTGFQAAGLLNIAGSLDGVQAAPINITTGSTGGDAKAKGFAVQLGIVNISHEERVLPIGMVNIVKNGLLHPALYYDSMGFTNVSFRSGTKHFYSVLSVGSGHLRVDGFGSDQNEDLWTYRFGFGFELPLGRVFLDLDCTAGHIFDQANILDALRPITETMGDNQYRGESGKQMGDLPVSFTVQARLTAGFKLFEHLGFFAGVSYDYIHRWNDSAPVLVSGGFALPEWSRHGDFHRMGLFAGLQF